MTSAAFYTDSREYDPVEVIADALGLYAAGQDADRLAVRCLRPLWNADGTPVLNDRHEQRRDVLAGVYSRDESHRAAEHLAALEAAGGWHCYWHAQRVSAAITNRLLPGAQGTVRSDGVAAYTTLIADLDPDPNVEVEPGRAAALADDLAAVLAARVGIPREAMLLQQSGRGAYLLISIEPQPLGARPVLRDALRMLARLIGAAHAPLHVDQAVHDPARSLRIAGTTNRKADADATTPAWILRPWTPGVRAPWSCIERLAAPSRPRLRVVPGGRTTRSPRPAVRRPLRELFTVRGWLYRERPDGVCDVRCPQAESHTDGREGAILYPPREPGGPGWVHCSHAHCANMGLPDIYRALESETQQ